MPTLSVTPGDVLAGKYRVERVLGAGGMGYVVAARHLQLDQLVAMKFLRKSAIENVEAWTRFLREAKAVVKLRNEHVAKVFDVGTLDGGEPYIVMEYLEGSDLAAMTKVRATIPPSEAAEYVIQSCEALAEAHALGIIHRDIKLANLFVTRGPAGVPLVKVLDFGISKTNPFGESEHDMTRTASMLGSPRFMSPEQMRDPRAVDGRSDIWSLGVVLYRLVAGRPPFEAETLGRLLSMVMHEREAPLSTVCAGLPPGFEDVVARCLEKDPEVRFKNVAEFAYALVPFSPDPTRASSAADRIAAVLGLNNGFSPIAGMTGDYSIPLGSPTGRASQPPGASDTGGTAAPWSGTHGGTKPKSTTATIWLGVALATILVGSGAFAKFRHDAQMAAAARSAAAAAIAATRTSEPPPAVTAPSSSAEPPPVAPAPTILGASPMTPPSSTPKATRAETGQSTKRAPSWVGRTKSAAPTRPPAMTVTARTEDGIPTTRD